MKHQEILDTIIREGDSKRFEYHGYKCEIKRNFMGALCGYVNLKEPVEMTIYAHGTITFQEGLKIGFDCAHLPYDYVAFGLPKELREKLGHDLFREGEYRTMAFVKMEIKRIVDQIHFRK